MALNREDKADVKRAFGKKAANAVQKATYDRGEWAKKNLKDSGKSARTKAFEKKIRAYKPKNDRPHLSAVKAVEGPKGVRREVSYLRNLAKKGDKARLQNVWRRKNKPGYAEAELNNR